MEVLMGWEAAMHWRRQAYHSQT
ncbi:uncharacterized protein METZ01_LOCUS335721, partial [marine metagenome]